MTGTVTPSCDWLDAVLCSAVFAVLCFQGVGTPSAALTLAFLVPERCSVRCRDMCVCMYVTLRAALCCPSWLLPSCLSPACFPDLPGFLQTCHPGHAAAAAHGAIHGRGHRMGGCLGAGPGSGSGTGRLGWGDEGTGAPGASGGFPGDWIGMGQGTWCASVASERAVWTRGGGVVL